MEVVVFPDPPTGAPVSALQCRGFFVGTLPPVAGLAAKYAPNPQPLSHKRFLRGARDRGSPGRQHSLRGFFFGFCDRLLYAAKVGDRSWTPPSSKPWEASATPPGLLAKRPGPGPSRVSLSVEADATAIGSGVPT